MSDIYFDHSATTPLDSKVLDAMLPYLQDCFGNPSSRYRLGREARQGMEKARRNIAELIGAEPGEIVFTSGGTEANNMSILGTAYGGGKKGRHIITSSVEHRAVLEPCRYLEGNGFEISFLPVDDNGMVDPEQVLQAIRSDTILISIMHGNNEIGTIQPVEEIGLIAKEKGIPFHCDAVQSVGRISVDVNRINCDLLSISAHKFYGPKGVGCVYHRKDAKLLPLIRGGGQENGLRGGTQNLPAIAGMGKAAELAGDSLNSTQKEVSVLRDRIIEGISDEIPEAVLNGHRFKRLPGNVSFSFNNLDGAPLVAMMDEKGIAASNGSACHSDIPSPSHVLKAMGYSDKLAQSTVRLTVGRGNNNGEVDYLLAVFPDIIDSLRDVPPRQADVECSCQNRPSPLM
ncbi:MAG: cysteine desulfurase [Syntrophomonadaceae bacterium]|nr:cysteine desulfurase [Syntrophomonadaceae bacterium]